MKFWEIAGRRWSPAVEDKPLAISMDGSAAADRAIPLEFYKAVAEIIHITYVRSLRKASAK